MGKVHVVSSERREAEPDRTAGKQKTSKACPPPPPPRSFHSRSAAGPSADVGWYYWLPQRLPQPL